MSLPLLEIMRQAYCRAVQGGHTVRRWEVNFAARTRLIYENKTDAIELPDPDDGLFMRPIFGVPVARLIDETDDPRFNLIVDERPVTNAIGPIEPPQDFAETVRLMAELRAQVDRHFYGDFHPSRHNCDGKIVTASQSKPLDPR